MNINGQMGEVMMVNGAITKCMGKETFIGLMEENMKGSMSKIKSKDLEYLDGLMADSMLDNGLMGNNMGKGLL